MQAIQYEKLNSPKLFKRKYRFHLREFSNTSFAVSEAERVKKPSSYGSQILLWKSHPSPDF